MDQRVVWKFSMPLADSMTLTLPQGAELLHVADQEGYGRQLDFWALVTPGSVPEVHTDHQEDREVRLLATGRPVDRDDLSGFGHWQTVLAAASAPSASGSPRPPAARRPSTGSRRARSSSSPKLGSRG